MAVMTLSREPYSGGSSLAAAVAEKLGYKLVTRKEISKIFQEYGLITFDSFYSSPLNIWERMDDVQQDYMNFLVKVLKHLGYIDNLVILGRGSFSVFSQYRDVVNVRLWAPLELRIEHCMDKEFLDHSEAKKRVLLKDKLRSSFIAHCFHIHKGRMEDAFDFVFNMDKVESSEAVDLLVSSMKNLEGREDVTGNSIKELNVDSILERSIRNVLKL